MNNTELFDFELRRYGLMIDGLSLEMLLSNDALRKKIVGAVKEQQDIVLFIERHGADKEQASVYKIPGIRPVECTKSCSGKHELRYPRYEEGLDKEKLNYAPYCKHCYLTEEEIKEKTPG